MTDEIRAAEHLVRALAPPGCAVPIPEPFAMDESRWLLRAADKGLIEFSPCDDRCTHAGQRATRPLRDHFEADRDGTPRHLFSDADDRHASLHRDYVPAIAAYARAVLDLGYDADRCRLLTAPAAMRRRRWRAPTATSRTAPTTGRSHVELCTSNGPVLVLAKGDRRATRRLATALDVTPTLTQLAAPHDADVEAVVASSPAFLWIVGPNTIEPESHVFRVRGSGADTRVSRVSRLPDAS